MPVLSNPKHERFAQERAKGKTQDDAYVLAGYKPSRPHAARLATNGNVVTRVAELLERAADRTEATVVGITKRLLNIAAVAEKTGITKDPETGEITGSSAKHLAAARAALMDAAKLNGLIIEKQEHTGAVTFSMVVEAAQAIDPNAP